MLLPSKKEHNAKNTACLTSNEAISLTLWCGNGELFLIFSGPRHDPICLLERWTRRRWADEAQQSGGVPPRASCRMSYIITGCVRGPASTHRDVAAAPRLFQADRLKTFFLSLSPTFTFTHELLAISLPSMHTKTQKQNTSVVESNLWIHHTQSLIYVALFRQSPCCICCRKHHFCSQRNRRKTVKCFYLESLWSKCVYCGYLGVLNRLDQDNSTTFTHTASSVHFLT